MKKTLIKHLFKKIKSNVAGFITISIIVALGIGFLVGLLITTPDLQQTVSQYYSVNNVADITLKSSIGFDYEDSLKIINEKLGDDISEIQIDYQIDKLIKYNDAELASRIIYKDFDEQKINKIELLSGNYPQKDNEIVVEQSSQYIKDIRIGETIILDENEYIVTGIVKNPLYFSNEKEFTTIQSGKLDSIIYLDDSLIKDEKIFTDINITISNTKHLNTFSNKYFSRISDMEDKIKEIKDEILNSSLKTIENSIKIEIANAIKAQLKESLGVLATDEFIEWLINLEYFQNKILEQTKIQMENFSNPSLYILNRKSNTSFYTYDMQAKKVTDVAIVFPIFFLIIAALITVSTLERMVEEDRIIMGTLKSLGYSRSDIMGTYIAYSLIACLFGIVIGTFIGIFLLPYVIYVIYLDLFSVPALIFGIDVLTYILSITIMTLAILLATIYTTYRILKERPNALLTQKPIKNGKKIFLEKIPFLWNRLKFKYKSTVRNLFRFKKNALMMIIGVAGSTGLVLAAFGMNDSIGAITDLQYTKILNYNTIVEVTDYKIDPFENLNDVLRSSYIYKTEAKSTINEDLDFNLMVDTGAIDFNEYVNFYNTNNEKMVFKDNDVFISEQISYLLGIDIGDGFTFKIDDFEYNCSLTGIFENHVENYMFISNEIVNTIFKEDEINPNCYIAFINDLEDSENQDNLIIELTNKDNVKGVEITYQSRVSYSNVLNTLQLIVAVLIIFAGLLEITSIYSLTNISISERTREIATLKVLGYRKREVVGYIYRETSILAAVGILLGFLCGFLLHMFVISKIHSIGLFLGTILNPLSYLYAFLISLMFIIFVDLIFIPRFNSLSMIESLKSVE